MKSENFKYTVGSLFVCSKCGKAFDAPDQAENLKTELRAELKKTEDLQKIRVMVGSCLGVCDPDRQTFAYFPHQGKAEIYSTEKEFNLAKDQILGLLRKKLV